MHLSTGKPFSPALQLLQGRGASGARSTTATPPSHLGAVRMLARPTSEPHKSMSSAVRPQTIVAVGHNFGYRRTANCCSSWAYLLGIGGVFLVCLGMSAIFLGLQ